jgi:membrane-associated phospholipid phosphatase
MSSTAFFCAYIVLNFMNKNNYNLQNLLMYKPSLLIVNIILIIMMAWARYYKKCHNITQIIGGTIYGLGLAYLFFNINKFF